jgi:hypothetical protein
VAAGVLHLAEVAVERGEVARTGGLLLGGPVLSPVLQTLAWTAALTVVFAPLAIREFRRLS